MDAVIVDPRLALAPGTMLDDKYRIDQLLAVGGMGAVYVGTHVLLRKRIAIKILKAELASGQMLERFHREAIAASQIGHEGIVEVTDLGTTTLGEPFLIMEFLEGESLGERLRSTGALPIEVACELCCNILSPLDAAHAAGIVHRDLKPDNVFLVRQSRGELVKLLDFGISRMAAGDSDFRLTTTGLVLGTPHYMSPEQARGDNSIGPPADLYAVGVILYELLTGRVPYTADNYNQLMYRVMTGDFPRPRALRPEIPDELESIIFRAMAHLATARFPDAADLEQALLPFCRESFRLTTLEQLQKADRRRHETRPLATPAAIHVDMLAATATPTGLSASAGASAGASGGMAVAARRTPLSLEAPSQFGRASTAHASGRLAAGAAPVPGRRLRTGLLAIGSILVIAVVVAGGLSMADRLAGEETPAAAATPGPAVPGPTIEPGAEPATEPVARPVAEPLARPAADPIADPVADAAIEPAAVTPPARTHKTRRPLRDVPRRGSQEPGKPGDRIDPDSPYE